MTIPHVKFIVDQKLDIENYLIGLKSYKGKLHSSSSDESKKYKRLLKISEPKRKSYFKKQLSSFYSVKNRKKLEEIQYDIQKHWNSIEKKFFKIINKVFNKPFPYQSVKGVLSTANRFGYSTKNRWFATSIDKNKFYAADIAMHELTHFVFHHYFWKKCENLGLKWRQVWDIKEATSVLLNLEFADLRLQPDKGYREHKKIREFITKQWRKNKDFEKILDKTCRFVATNKNLLK